MYCFDPVGCSSLTCPSTTSTPFTTVYSYDVAPISFKEWDGHMVLADGGGGASTNPAPAAPPATLPARNSDGGAPAPKHGDWWNLKCEIQQHAQDLKKISDISGAIAEVAGTVAAGCAVVGAVAAETVAGGIAAGASAVSFVSGAVAKAGGANVSDTDLALSAVGAIPGVGAVGRVAEDVAAWRGSRRRHPKATTAAIDMSKVLYRLGRDPETAPSWRPMRNVRWPAASRTVSPRCPDCRPRLPRVAITDQPPSRDLIEAVFNVEKTGANPTTTPSIFRSR